MKSMKTLAVLIFASTILLGTGTHDQAEALLADHQCAFCHSLHGGPGYALLSAETSELVCLSCHTVSINDTAAAEVHNPLGLTSNQSGYVTCRECHDAHSNQGGNIKLVGYRRDGENFFESFAYPAIRKELPATLGLNYNVVTFTGPNDFNIADPAVLGPCEVCHTPYHNAGNDCTLCHGHSEGFPKPDCTASGCHDGLGTGAKAVGVGSSHSTNTILASKGITFTCGDCHTSHGTAGNVLIANNTTVGINYNSAGHGGISLGSSVATGATEAEICWNCHANAAVGVSEWGLNTATNGTANNYDHGDLSGPIAPAWVNALGTSGATWTSAESDFAYKLGSIGSTHSVNSSVTVPGLDPVASIRCSYCHDVHELNVASGDTTSGKPYLRGSWRGNPYFEDGAPQTTSSYTPRHWGAVPRASTLNNEIGGYQIDQNNSFPTAGGTAPTWNNTTETWTWPAGLWTLSDSAGLCVLCHTSNVDGMNKFGSSSSDWVGTNGHSNAAIGGTGTNAVNIFRTSWRAPSGVDTDGANPDMGYSNHGTSVGYGFRGTDGRSFTLVPGMDGQLSSNTSRPYGGKEYQWGAVVDDSTTEIQYHQFSCSKCHNPHAAKLPRLMITNCLDTKLTEWDDPRSGMNAVNVGNANNNKITLSATTSPDNWGRTWSNTTSAQNCHRLAGDNRATPVPGFGAGWNNVTPW